MGRQYDPLSLVPSQETLRKKLAEAECLVRKLKILLRITDEIGEAERSDDSQEDLGDAR